MFKPQKKSEAAPKQAAAKLKPKTAPAPSHAPTWANESLQTKLTINEPSDEYEQEADQIAEQVMRMPEPGVQRRCACGGAAGPDGECAACRAQRLMLQRQEMLEEEEEELTSIPSGELQRQAINGDEEEEEDVGALQRKTAHAGETAGDAPNSVHQTLGQSGQPLDSRTRAYMEPRFGQDFSDVRVHTDSQAAQSAADVSARAYTVGSDIVFGAGQYQPGSSTGDRLIAHELAHTVQQSDPALGLQRALEHVKPYPAVILSTEEMNDDQKAVLERSQYGNQAKVYNEPNTSGKPTTVLMPETSVTVNALVNGGSWIHITHPPIKALGGQKYGYILGAFVQRVQVQQVKKSATPSPSGIGTGKKVEKFGIAYKEEGVNLRDLPRSHADSKVLELLPLNTRMYVDSVLDNYYFVSTDDGKFGYVAVSHVKTNLPEPNAKIYHIKSGDTALGISRKFYGGKAEWGQDHRFFVNGLVYINRGEGPRGIYKPNPEDDWDTTKVTEGYMIWVPSLRFMRSLQGVVKSGSITYEAWQTVKEAAIAVGEFLLGTGAFIVGLLHGALESLWDILVGIKDLLVMAVDLIKWVVRYIAGDAKGLWESIKDIEWAKLVQGWIDDFVNKWNNKNFLKKWHFRGWVIGYVIAEILLLIFSGGIINGIKWVGKSAKVAKVISKLPKIAEISKAAKASKTGQKLAKGFKASQTAFKGVNEARKWAAATLKLSGSVLRDLTLTGINKLRQLSEPVLKRIADLSGTAKRWLLGCASECKVSLDKIRKSLKEMSDSELEQAAARLAKVLEKLRMPRLPVKFVKQGRHVDTDALLKEVFAERKRLLIEAGDDSWMRNIASARVTVDGKPRIITHVNDPGGLHSEAKILKEMENLRKTHRVEGVEIYSERIPCIGGGCRSSSIQAFETVTYHSPHPASGIRQSMKGLKKNVDYLKALYGLND